MVDMNDTLQNSTEPPTESQLPQMPESEAPGDAKEPILANSMDSTELAAYLPSLGRALVGRLIEQVGVVTEVAHTPQGGSVKTSGSVVRGDMSPRIYRGTLTVVSR